MRILHVVTVVDDANSYGGPLTVAVNQCTELRRQGHDAQILAGWLGSGLPPDSVEGVPAHLFPVHNIIPGMRFSGLFSARMLRWLRRNARSYDAAHLHTARDLVPLLAGLVLRGRSVRYVTQTHGMVLPDERPAARLIDRLFTMRVLRGAAVRFVLTDKEEQAIEQLLKTPDSTTHLPNGVTIPNIERKQRKPLDILFMARLHPRKRVTVFAEAAAAILADGHDVQFSVVGPDDGDLPWLQAFIDHRPELDGRLRYEGSLSHSAALTRLAKSAIFVLPSIDEPFPMALLEAMALGLPTICVKSCGLASLIKDETAGVVIADSDAHSVIQALSLFLMDPAQRAQVGKRASEFAKSHHSMDSIARKLLAVYAHTLLSNAEIN